MSRKVMWRIQVLAFVLLLGVVATLVVALNPGILLGRAPSSVAVDSHHLLLMRQFDRLALSSEFGGVSRDGRIVRWDVLGAIVTVRVFGRHREGVVLAVRQHLALLSRLTGLRFEMLDDVDTRKPNISVHVLSGSEVSYFAPGASCFVQLYASDYRIRRAEVMIPFEPPILRDHCVAEELTQAMGLMNDSDLFHESVFHDQSRLLGLTAIDQLMVRVLYDKRIYAGARRGVVWKNLPGILDSY